MVVTLRRHLSVMSTHGTRVQPHSPEGNVLHNLVQKNLYHVNRTVARWNIISQLNIGMVNARLAINKAVELHAVIRDNRLDILIITETWFQPDTMNVIASDIAPPSFKDIGAPRPDGHRGDSRAVAYADNLKVTAAPNQISPTSFEPQTVRLAIAGEHFVITGATINKHRRLMFFDELADLFDATASIGGHVVHTGDFNRNVPETIDDHLSALLSCYNMVTVNNGATHLH